MPSAEIAKDEEENSKPFKSEEEEEEEETISLFRFLLKNERHLQERQNVEMGENHVTNGATIPRERCTLEGLEAGGILEAGGGRQTEGGGRAAGIDISDDMCLRLESARQMLVELGHTEEEVDAFVHASSLWTATSPRNIEARATHTARTAQTARMLTSISERERLQTGITEKELVREQALSLQEWETRGHHGHGTWLSHSHEAPDSSSRPATCMHEVEEISLEAFLSGMRSVQHTRRRLAEEARQRRKARAAGEGGREEQEELDPDRAAAPDIASFFDVTKEYHSTMAAAARSRATMRASKKAKSKASTGARARKGGGGTKGNGDNGGGHGRGGRQGDVEGVGEEDLEFGEGGGQRLGVDGPAAVWLVLTTCQWAEQTREHRPKDVAKLVSEAALRVLCRGEDEAATQRTMMGNVPYRVQATLWEGAQLKSMPASMLRNAATLEMARLAPEIKYSLFDPATCVGVAGDWVVGSTIEGAWVSGDALATAVITDIACNAGREASLISRQQENLSDAAFSHKEERWKQDWASSHTNRRLRLMEPILLRWRTLLPAAKALHTWLEFADRQQRLKSLFLTVFTSQNELLLADAWAAWEELVAEAHARKVMKSILEMLHGSTVKDAFDAWLKVAINGPGWKLMLALRKQRDMLYLKRVVDGWFSVTQHDKSRVILPMFVSKREFREMQLHFEAWQTVKQPSKDSTRSLTFS